ncbi:MAG: hypothetical protein PHN18_03130 [Sulfurospirillaceae bacterium]|nr:hypothetical protein [Sulfurospirillaceae bacterium]MDD2825600.1 hypothetical protein [Sulfurospirillaceae bacterium]
MKSSKEKISSLSHKRTKLQWLQQYLPTFLAAVLLSFVLYEISFYIFKTYRAFFNSDAAIANILAEEIVLEGSFFPSHWWYVNNDLWVFYKQALVIPWVLLGKNGYFAHAFTVFIVSIFMVVFIYNFFRALMLSRASALMGSVVVCIGYSPMYLRELYGEAAYTWYFIFMIAFLYMFRKLSPHVIRKSTKIKAFFLFLILLYLLVLANPIRFIVYYVAPFFGALALMVYLARDSVKTFNESVMKLLSIKKVVIFICAMAVIGIATIAHYSLLESLHFSGGANKAELMPLEALPVHVAHAFLGLINFIGGEWNDGVLISSVEGVVSLAKFFLYPMVLLFPALYVKKYFYQMSSSERMTVLYSYVGFAIIMLLYSTTSLHEHAWAARNNIRYISPFIMMILLSNVIMWRFFPVFVKLVLSLCLAISLALSWNYVSPKGWRCIVDERIALVEELKNHDLHFGYATYWDSHMYTVFSDGEVDIRPIKFTDTGLSAETWLSSDGWYQKDSTPGKVFFLANGDDIDDFYNGMKKMNMPDPIEQFTFGNYTIIVFEKNPLYVQKTKAEPRKKKRIIMAP